MFPPREMTLEYVIGRSLLGSFFRKNNTGLFSRSFRLLTEVLKSMNSSVQ